MDPIVTTALVGTARQEQSKPITGTPVDVLLAELPEGELERTFLLSAGAWAVYRQAGRQSRPLASIPEPALAEHLPVCTPGAALLLSRLLNGEQSALLPEALERLRALGMRLPHSLLPLALNTTGKELRAALFPVLGERAVWLSQFNPAWKWVRNYLPANTNGLPDDAETVWQEGTTGQRVEILRRLRAADPEKARAWLEAVWKQEKVDARCDLLHALEVALSAADEPFLENALDDRGASVRAGAVELLSRLPGSALSERMRQRGRAMLKLFNGEIEIELPAMFGKDWARDGILEKPPTEAGKRAWWMTQVLTAIPPTFWEAEFGAGSAELLTLLPDNEWKGNVIHAWSQAAVSYTTSNWAMPLWRWWQEYYSQPNPKYRSDDSRGDLLKCMSREEAESALLALISVGKPEDEWQERLTELPRPWSREFARQHLQLCRTNCTSVERLSVSTFNPYYDPWFESLSTLALALPVPCFAEALLPWEVPDLPEKPAWQIQRARERLQEFTETVQMRQKIYEEII